MVVIYAEKASLATDLAHFLKAGKRIPLKEEPQVGYYEFTFKGEPAIWNCQEMCSRRIPKI